MQQLFQHVITVHLQKEIAVAMPIAWGHATTVSCRIHLPV